MKKSRKIALNWAFAAFAAIAVIYGIFELFGSMPAVSSGGYDIPYGQKDGIIQTFQMPAVSAEYWLLIVPLLAFSIAYFKNLYLADKKGFKEGMIAGTIGGTIVGTIAGMIAGTIGGTIVGTIAGTIGGTIVGTIDGTIVGTIGGTIVGTICVLIHFIFLSPYKGEAVIIVPAAAAGLLVLNMMLISALPMAIAVIERVFSKSFWTNIAQELFAQEKALEKQNSVA